MTDRVHGDAMSRVRIVCKTPRPEPRDPGGSYPLINGFLATIADCSVYLVGVDGIEHEITNVTAVSFDVKQGVDEIARVHLTCNDVELDVDADLPVHTDGNE